MKKKFKGFSLAELLIALLVISIVLSAAIPTITKRSAGGEQIWRWAREHDSNYSNSAYFGVGATQTAIVGATTIPEIDNPLAVADGEEVNNVRFSNSGDKLVLVKQTTRTDSNMEINSNMINSHISFYTLRNADDATSNDIHYAGRLSMDMHNIALGIGTLQSMDNIHDDFVGHNTAIGHVALLNNKSGQYNTAIGEKTLADVKNGNFNTALGFQAGINVDQEVEGNETDASFNTIIGAYAANAATKIDKTTAVGSLSCSKLETGSHNICMGYGSTPVGNDVAGAKYGLFIGAYDGTDTDFAANRIDVPLISGWTQYSKFKNKLNVDVIKDRSLEVNTYNFKVRPFDATEDILAVTAHRGTDYTEGYDTTDKVTQGFLNFNTYINRGTNPYITGLHIKTGTELTSYTGATNVPVTSAQARNLDVLFEADKLNLISGYWDNVNQQVVYEDNLDIFSQANFNFSTTPNEINFLVMKNVKSNIAINKDDILLEFADSTKGSNEYNARLLVNDKLHYYDAAGKTKLEVSQNGVTLMATGESLKLDPTNGFNVYTTKGFAIESANALLTEGYYKLKSGNSFTFEGTGSGNSIILDFSRQDIRIPSLTQQGSLVAQNINALWQKIDHLEVNTGFSDIRLKENISDNTAGLKEINALEVKNYTYKKDEKKTPHVGVIAQQLQKVFPNSVVKDENGYLKIRTEEIFYAMVNSIKELFAQVQDLTAKIVGLDKRIVELEKENEALKKQNAEFEKRLEKLEKKLAK